MSGPTFKMAPSAAELAAIECPFERAARITTFARNCGTLPHALFVVRRDILRDLRSAKHSAGKIAARVGLSRARIFDITRLATRHSASEGER